MLNDTTREIEELQNELWMKKTPQERGELALAMSKAGRDAVIASLSRSLSDEEFKKQLFFRLYGENLPEDFFGYLPKTFPLPNRSYQASLTKSQVDEESMYIKLTRKLVFPFILLLAAVSFGQTVPMPAFESLRDLPKIRDFTMTSDGTEAYFTVQSLLEEVTFIATMEKRNGKWQEPSIASFSGKHRDLEPSLSTDGLKLFFVSTRPLDGKGKAKDHDIWFVTRKRQGDKWSPPKNLGAPVNSSKEEFYPSVAANGNIYFTLEETGINPDIVMSKWNGESHEKPVALNDSINSEGHEYNAFVAPDESLLIFGAYQRKDGFGSGDLYISYRGPDGNWSTAENIGKEINSAAMDFCPFVDFRNRTLYFTSRRSSVESGPIVSIGTFIRETSKYENGQSRLYKVTLSEGILRGPQK